MGVDGLGLLLDVLKDVGLLLQHRLNGLDDGLLLEHRLHDGLVHIQAHDACICIMSKLTMLNLKGTGCVWVCVYVYVPVCMCVCHK